MWAGKALFGDGKRQVRTPIARAGNAVLAASVNANAAAISQPRPGRGERQSGSGPLLYSCRPPCGARAVNFRRSGQRWLGAVFGGLKNGRLGKARGSPGRCQPRRAGGAADKRGLCLGNVYFGPYFGLHSGSRFSLHRRRGFAGAFVRAGEVRFCGLFLRSFAGSRRACWLGCGGTLPDGCVNLAFRICLSNQQIARC